MAEIRAHFENRVLLRRYDSVGYLLISTRRLQRILDFVQRTAPSISNQLRERPPGDLSASITPVSTRGGLVR